MSSGKWLQTLQRCLQSFETSVSIYNSILRRFYTHLSNRNENNLISEEERKNHGISKLKFAVLLYAPRFIAKQIKTPDKIRNIGPFVCKYDLALGNYVVCHTSLLREINNSARRKQQIQYTSRELHIGDIIL